VPVSGTRIGIVVCVRLRHDESGRRSDASAPTLNDCGTIQPLHTMIAPMSRSSRRSRWVALCLIHVIILTAACPAGAAERLIREQRIIKVQGAKEIWQLAWEGKPATVCGPDEVHMAITCPCSGFAYGEYGKLSLIRWRGGREVEQMDLGPLFELSEPPLIGDVKGVAYVQRWPRAPADFERAARVDRKLVADIKRRPTSVIMRFADYDRDGEATEFLIQVGTLPCGKWQFAAVGVSAREPRLHALTSAAKPDGPLIMPLAAWQALLQGPGPQTVATWACGDHGSESRAELIVSAGSSEIHVRRREFSCPADGQAETLLKESDE
jgi:hypothetical protein